MLFEQQIAERRERAKEAIARILERLAQGSSAEAALRATVHADYRQLRDEMTRTLQEKYGE